MKKQGMTLLAAVIAVMLSFSPATGGEPPKDAKKLTENGKYVTALEAYEAWKANPDTVMIIDCRIPEEYVFVGHAPMAYNCPSKLWTGEWDPEKKDYNLKDNPDFEAYVKAKFKPTDQIMIMCRSGQRSAASVNRLIKAGFVNVHNIVDGFEGDKVSDIDSCYDGKRMRNGWKNSGSPWTYALNPGLLYIPRSN
jgi:rhodanese-related sulfurtransferase